MEGANRHEVLFPTRAPSGPPGGLGGRMRDRIRGENK